MATGFFGKLPASGDFVARGLPPGVQTGLDRWLTRLLLASDRSFRGWPEDGFCGVVEVGAVPLAVLVLPSRDASGRRFPLAAIAPAGAAGKAGIDLWAGQVRPALLQAVEAALDPAGLIEALRDISDPEGGEGLPAPLIWDAASDPQEPVALIVRLAGG